MKAVILCGGSGTRLWPISRKKSPKQFFKFFGEKSLFQLTIERNIELVEEFIIVVNKDQVDICKSQIPADIKVKIIVESAARNTAPAIALAAFCAGEDVDLIVLPSDHLIQPKGDYHQTIKQAEGFKDSLVTFGIQPQYPETGYGYIQASGFNVESFKEKPDLETAKTYLAAGNYYWNSGMFFFNSSVFLKELEHSSPEIFQKTKLAFDATERQQEVYMIPKDLMLAIPKDSIDYAVMEKSRSVKVVPVSYQWNDLGSFDAVYDSSEKNSNGTACDTNLIEINSTENLIISDKKVVTTFNVNDLIIVETKDALLIGRRGDSQEVKTIFNEVEKRFPELLD